MSSTIPVVSTYACHTLERLLTLKNPQNPRENVFESADIQKFLPYVLTNVMNLLSPGTNENEYAMKALMRLCLTLQEHIDPYLEEVVNKLTLLLNAVIKVIYDA